ncbi:guanylate kinase [Segatella maculosa]|uniref:guanylate kinase n=1 Tax=Segatella maculosa TaxID=439703 RepID=UPI0028D12B91|nr:guanylate kinase [Segatella maculosa]
MIKKHDETSDRQQSTQKDSGKDDRKPAFPGYQTAHSYAYDLLKRFSKDNRRYATEAESILWNLLRGKQLGVRFRRQHPVEGYIPDFICLSCKLIIEVDGGYHYLEGQPISDEERTVYLEAKGYHVLRFTNEEVIAAPEKVLSLIKDELNKRLNMAEQNNVLHHPTTPSQVNQNSLDPPTSGQSPRVASPSQINQNSLDPVGTPLLRRGRGRLLVFSAPSGSGKSTIVQWLVKEHPELNLHFSVSCTSRLPRGTEQNGVEYFFISPEEFKKKIENEEFIEYEEVYKDRYYGTLKSQVEQQISRGENVVFDVDVKGGCNIKQCYGSRAMSIFVQPPSIEELRRRLNSRGTDTPEVIEQRLAKADYELSFARKFDHIVVNDDLETAKQKTYELLSTFLNQR